MASKARLLLAIGGLLIGTSGAAAQMDSRPLPVSLLRRLAEVTEGQGVANEVWVVARYGFPHEVAGVFTTRAEAARLAGTIPGAGAFGPFRKLLPGITKFVPVGCHHDGTRSVYALCPARGVPLSTVRTVTITTRFTNGDSATVTVPAAKVDAIFFTLDAMDKFAFPYYVRLLGLEEATRLRREMLDQIN